MFTKSILLVILSLSLFFQACSTQEDESKSATFVENEYRLVATDTTSEFLIKKEAEGFSLADDASKIILLDIFATWCPPCQASASHLSSLQDKYKDDLLILGVTIEDDISNAELESFKKEFNARYTIVNSQENSRLIDAVASNLELGARFPIPILAMYKDGKLINHYIGEVQEEFLESDIKKALGK